MKLDKPIYKKLLKYFNKNNLEDKIIIIDRIEADSNFKSGLKCRVINIYKKPTWFDSGWFK